jgi:hypothetical protein
VAPRVIWAKVIADKFKKSVWHAMQHVFNLKFFDVIHTDANVSLRLKRAAITELQEMRTDVDMFIRRTKIPPGLLKH